MAKKEGRIPKGSYKMKDFPNKLWAERFQATQKDGGWKTKLTSYYSMGLKNHKKYAVYYWLPKKK